MKKILLLLAILLSGCTVVDAYLMTKYDANEYQMITDIRSKARQSKTQCDDANISKINSGITAYSTQLFVLYSEHIPRNKDMIDASQALNTIAQGLADQYKNTKVSTAFCKIKFESIETSAEKMQVIIGGRPR
jgi:hypothetical protein